MVNKDAAFATCQDQSVPARHGKKGVRKETSRPEVNAAEERARRWECDQTPSRAWPSPVLLITPQSRELTSPCPFCFSFGLLIYLILLPDEETSNWALYSLYLVLFDLGKLHLQLGQFL